MMYRQGEVLIRKLKGDEIPDYNAPVSEYNKEKAFKKRKSGVIVEGEITGHKHAVTGGVLMDRASQGWRTPESLFLHTDAPVEVTHNEHAPVKLPEGDFEITFQREYDEENRHRRVID